MATSNLPDLGQELVNLGKLCTACTSMRHIAMEIKKFKEGLKSLEQEYVSLSAITTAPGVRDLVSLLRKCIDSAEKTCKHAMDIDSNYSRCLQEMKVMTDSGSMARQQVDFLTASMKALLDGTEKFEQSLQSLINELHKLQRQSQTASDEEEKEELRLRKEASNTLSEANRKRKLILFGRIASFGIITLSPAFNKYVAQNKGRYLTVDKLHSLAEQLRKARYSLNAAMKTMEFLDKIICEEAVPLTRSAIEIMLGLLRWHQKMEEKIAKQQQELDRQTMEVQSKQEDMERQMNQLERNKAEMEREKADMARQRADLEREKTEMREKQELAKQEELARRARAAREEEMTRQEERRRREAELDRFKQDLARLKRDPGAQ